MNFYSESVLSTEDEKKEKLHVYLYPDTFWYFFFKKLIMRPINNVCLHNEIRMGKYWLINYWLNETLLIKIPSFREKT